MVFYIKVLLTLKCCLLMTVAKILLGQFAMIMLLPPRASGVDSIDFTIFLGNDSGKLIGWIE